jgi:hypothetical protein
VEIFYPDLSGDNACNSIVIHPDDPDVAYAGMEGAVIKTTDGGKTWSYTGLRNTLAYFYGLALDTATPAHILPAARLRIRILGLCGKALTAVKPGKKFHQPAHQPTRV